MMDQEFYIGTAIMQRVKILLYHHLKLITQISLSSTVAGREKMELFYLEFMTMKPKNGGHMNQAGILNHRLIYL